MKQKIRIVDNISKKVVEKEVNIPDKMHLDAQIRYRANVYRDRTKYTRKQKHRNRNDYEHALLVQQQVYQPSKLMVTGQHRRRAPCRISLMVKYFLAKEGLRVQFPHTAPKKKLLERRRKEIFNMCLCSLLSKQFSISFRKQRIVGVSLITLSNQFLLTRLISSLKRHPQKQSIGVFFVIWLGIQAVKERSCNLRSREFDPHPNLQYGQIAKMVYAVD